MDTPHRFFILDLDKIYSGNLIFLQIKITCNTRILVIIKTGVTPTYIIRVQDEVCNTPLTSNGI